MMDSKKQAPAAEASTEPTLPASKDSSKWKGWRRSLAFGALISFIALLSNVAALVWACTRVWQDTNTVVLYQGSNDEMKKVNAGVHAITTIFSSLLLAGGNASMQVMMAPTRIEVDTAHGKGRWLDIGTPSLRNLFSVSRRRCLVWFAVVLCSLPLHLIYNSVAFPTIVATNYVATLVTRDFPTGAPFNLTANNVAFRYTGSFDADLLLQLQQGVSSLIRLDNEDCIRAFSAQYVDNYLNVLLVSDTQFAENSILNGWTIHSTPEESDDNSCCGDARDWICDSSNANLCDAGNYEAVASNWQLPWDNPVVSISGNDEQDRWQLARVDYCLAQPFKPQCAVMISVPLLITVLVVNAMQLLFVAWALSMRSLHPLVTTGDAIASFTAEPDPTTVGASLLSLRDVRHGMWSRTRHQPAEARPWEARRPRWARAVSLRRWIITLLACLLIWALGLVLLICGLEFNFVTFQQLLSAGLGTIVPQSLVGFFGNLSTTNAALVANLPQLAISVLYYLYNGIFTSMVMSHEYTSYGSQLTTETSTLLTPKHKPRLHHPWPRLKAFILRRPAPQGHETLTPQAAGLRVSSYSGPIGAQRGTYFLNLPFRYAVPLLGASVLLHFFASQSIYPAQVTTVDNNGEPNIYYYVQACAWNAVALTVTLTIGLAMVLALLAFASLRRFHPGIPLAGSCSAAISAACHAVNDHELDGDVPRWPVSYGILGPMPGVEAVQKAGFGSGRVYPLGRGELYI